MRPTASSASKTLEKAQDKVHDKIHDRDHERGDTKVVKKVKSVIKGTTKSGGSESAATGEGKKDGYRKQTEEVGIKDSGDATQDIASAVAKENEKLTVREEEETPPVVEEMPKTEKGDNITEDIPPTSDVVPEHPEVTPIEAVAE